MSEDAFIGALLSHGKARIDYTDCERLFKETTPHFNGDLGVGLARLKECLDILRNDGIVQWNQKKCVVSRGPFLFPDKITIKKERSVPALDRAVEWDSRIAHLARGRGGTAFDDLKTVDAFLKLAAREPQPTLPLKARSLTIFGDEKRLEVYLSKDWKGFYDGALSTSCLCCYVPVDIYFVHDINLNSPSAEVLLVENQETYHVFKRWNRSTARYRAVAFGSGNTIQSSAPALDLLLEDVGAKTIRYFGDIDAPGFQIPLTARKKSATSGLEINLLPAVDLYVQCLVGGRPTVWKAKDDGKIGRWAAHLRDATREWLANEPLFEVIDDIVGSGRRVAQEWLHNPC
jgi:hypothetical protein